MKEYAFSGISTEKLRNAIESYDGYACSGISCKEDRCPFNIHYTEGGCCNAGEEREYNLFKAELERRDKLESNKMPALEAGMVVELYNTNDNVEYGLFLYINGDWCLDIHDNNVWQDIEAGIKVIKVYKSKNKGAYTSIKDSLELLWELKEDNSEKIKELEKTVKDAQELINNAVEQIKELKG